MATKKLTPRQFASRTGQQIDAVYQQLRSGRLPGQKGADGKWLVDWEPALASHREVDQSLIEPEAERSPKSNQAPPAAPFSLGSDENWTSIPDYETSRSARMYWQAKREEQDYLEKAGQLVPLEGIEQRYADHVATVRTKLLGVPTRLKQRLRLSESDFKLIEELIEEALEDLDDTGEATDPENDE